MIKITNFFEVGALLQVTTENDHCFTAHIIYGMCSRYALIDRTSPSIFSHTLHKNRMNSVKELRVQPL